MPFETGTDGGSALPLGHYQDDLIGVPVWEIRAIDIVPVVGNA